MLAGEEIFPVIETVNAHCPKWWRHLRKEALTKVTGCAYPEPSGDSFLMLADPVNARLVRFDCLNIRGQSGLEILPTTSAFARPVEGLSILVNVEDGPSDRAL